MSSPTTTALSRQPLIQVLRSITDPRDRRGVRHNLSTVLSLAVTGVLAGCRSLTAIWEHTTDLTATDLRPLGWRRGRLFRRSRPSAGCCRTWTPQTSTPT
ncbi:transposase family protein [Actinomyces naeslundii]|uniref:transposase family protein n=3 Tax=Actinomyces naeslundii TaxID=1655 RepID=UPI002115D7F4|nr:transposase family protein [Actinomyces naeslundii]